MIKKNIFLVHEIFRQLLLQFHDLLNEKTPNFGKPKRERGKEKERKRKREREEGKEKE